MFEQKDIIGTDVLDHLGLIAATISKLGLVEKIDEKMPMTQASKTTHGECAMAMILNGLGFAGNRLYLFPKFLENKPVARLFGKDLSANDFNDDALGGGFKCEVQLKSHQDTVSYDQKNLSETKSSSDKISFVGQNKASQNKPNQYGDRRIMPKS